MAVDRVAQAATDCRGGRSVHVVKAMLPICEQKIYVWSWSKSESGWSALETTLIYAHSRQRQHLPGQAVAKVSYVVSRSEDIDLK